MSEEIEFPEGALAKFMNLPFVLLARMGETAHAHPYVHVSDLLKNKPDNRFCIREYVLRWYELPVRPKGTVPPKMRLLWDTGNLIGDEVVLKRLIETSPDLGPLVWGDWECVACRKVTSLDYKPDGACDCGCVTFRYKEVDLREETVRLVGHPDLLIRLKDGTIIIYEIKTIDRSDIDFDGTQDRRSLLVAPLGDHHMQASYYYYLLKKLGHKVSKRIRFLYIDRSIDDMYREKPFIELVADVLPIDRAQAGIDTCKQAKHHVEKRTLPPRICDTPTDTRTSKCTTVASCFARRLNVIQEVTLRDSMSLSQAQASTSKALTLPKTSPTGTTTSPRKRKPGPTRRG